MNVIEITAEKETAQETIRLAAYCRVSSDSEDQLHSFAAQIRYYKDYERRNPQYKLVDIYADEGITGTCMAKRDDLHRLIRDCKKRMAEPDVYEAFSRMLFKLKEHHHAILGALIRDIEVMQSKTSENHEKIAEIDKEIADLAARNLVIARLHTSGILNGSDYSAQSSEINNRISVLRSERRKKLAEDEGDEQLDKLKELQGVLNEYEPTAAFNEDLFDQIVETATVMSRSEIVFQLIGGLKLTESIA